jgi:hypothetical protein
VAITHPDLQMPNLIIHLARMVHTPIGNAPSGMILWQPDVTMPPAIIGFVSTDSSVGAYFGPNIFAGTPFESVPVLPAAINIEINEREAFAKCVTGDYIFEMTLKSFSEPSLVSRNPSSMPPFYQQGVEVQAAEAHIKINGEEISFIIPPVGITGGPASVVAPNGVYARWL